LLVLCRVLIDAEHIRRVFDDFTVVIQSHLI
jgi:hypothetical protein